MVPDDAQSHALLQSVLGLSAILEGAPDGGREGERMTGTPLQSIFLEAFDKNSLVFLLSLRFGIILTFAALAAHAFNLNRSYWVPLSCAAVMLGSTVIATFHRAIQRSLGTMIGILAASAILWAHPQGIVISLAIMLFSFFAELLIVRNYTLTMMFVTPNALLMAAAGSHIEHVGYFAGTRMADVVTGSLIGLAGVLILGRTSASSRIPYLMGRAIRSQSQLLAVLFTGQIETGLPSGKPRTAVHENPSGQPDDRLRHGAGRTPAEREGAAAAPAGRLGVGTICVFAELLFPLRRGRAAQVVRSGTGLPAALVREDGPKRRSAAAPADSGAARA